MLRFYIITHVDFYYRRSLNVYATPVLLTTTTTTYYYLLTN